MQSIASRTVILTGGSRGIGRVLALKLKDDGANLVITGRNKGDLKKTEEELLRKSSGEVLAINADVSDYNDVKKVVKETADKFGKIDILINNAAVFKNKMLKDFDVDEWKKIIEVNLFGPMMMCREVIPYMEKNSDGGTIVNVASTAGKRGYERGSAYVSSKFALAGFSECLFKEVRNYNIRVVVAYPSYVDTKVVKEYSELKQIGKGIYMRAEDVADSILFAIKLPQRAMLKDIEIWGTNP